jgi:V-type H+-transporting ATPase subunit C
VVFKRVHDEFAQKCRENKYVLSRLPQISAHANEEIDRFILRDFTFSEDAVEKQREELRLTEASERDLWVCFFL